MSIFQNKNMFEIFDTIFRKLEEFINLIFYLIF
jgi:hypothetical protein